MHSHDQSNASYPLYLEATEVRNLAEESLALHMKLCNKVLHLWSCPSFEFDLMHGMALREDEPIVSTHVKDPV